MSTDNATSAEPISLRDELENAYDAAVQDTPTEQPAEAVTKTEDATTEDTTSISEPAAEDKPEELPAEDKPEEKPANTVKAPSSWKPDVREKFATLPDDVQAEILRREDNIGRLSRDHAQARDIATNFAKTVEPYREVIESAGVTPYQAVAEVLEVAKRLNKGTQREKAEVLGHLFDTYSIDLSELNDVLTARVTAPKPTATETAMLREIQDLKARIAPAPRPVAADQPNAINNEIEVFANDKKNEFFNDVSDDMAMLLMNGRANSLNDAYDKAVRMNEGVQKVLGERKAKDAQRVSAAQASVKGSSPKASKQPVKELSLRDTLSQAYDEAFGG